MPAGMLADLLRGETVAGSRRAWSEMRDEPGRTRPGDAWYVRSRCALFQTSKGKACRF